MFTGIISHTGAIEGVEPMEGGLRLDIRHDLDPPVIRGESIAVNGVCLTALPLPGDPSRFLVDLSAETLARTTLGSLAIGRRVSLERALTLGDRLGGHLVQGHVDARGALVEVIPRGEFADYLWQYPASHADLVVDKGSIAIDGISLTIVAPTSDRFTVAVIPETLERTHLVDLRPGDEVNLEFDIMAKYARHLFGRYVGASD